MSQVDEAAALVMKLDPHQQHAVAVRVASNIGYFLLPEPPIADATVKLARVPDKVHTIDELCGVITQVTAESIVVLIEDGAGLWSMTLDGTTAERMNWMLDRAKMLLHRID